MADVKICGLTRAGDARHAVASGARYVGVIFAGGPRRLDVAAAAAVLGDVPGHVSRVGVFGRTSADAIAHAADAARLDIVQLHEDPTPGDVLAAREASGARVWAVIRIQSSELPASVPALAAVADGILLDARAAGALGGTGRRLDWAALAGPLRPLRDDAAVVLAGGLTPDNVADAIAVLAPDVVDVSSGVESAPGIKDPERVRRFIEAARGAGASG